MILVSLNLSFSNINLIKTNRYLRAGDPELASVPAGDLVGDGDNTDAFRLVALPVNEPVASYVISTRFFLFLSLSLSLSLSVCLCLCLSLPLLFSLLDYFVMNVCAHFRP